MATRLYPITNNPATLERLAGVPAGTYAKLEALRATRNSRPGQENAQAVFYEAVYNDKNLVRMNNFNVFGWGRVNPDACPDYSGRETDPVKCLDILAAHGIEIDLSGENGALEVADLEGLCWN
jgi:hypothetical protein